MEEMNQVNQNAKKNNCYHYDSIACKNPSLILVGQFFIKLRNKPILVHYGIFLGFNLHPIYLNPPKMDQILTPNMLAISSITGESTESMIKSIFSC